MSPVVTKKKIKSSLYWQYYVKACKSGVVHLRGLAPGQLKNVAAVTNRLWQCVGLDRRRNETQNLLHYCDVFNQVVLNSFSPSTPF